MSTVLSRASLEPAAQPRLRRGATNIVSAGITALTFFLLSMSVGFVDDFTSSRVMPALLGLLLLHVLLCPKVLVTREFVLYGLFTAWMIVSLIWTDNQALASNTVTPVVNFLLTLVLVGSLVAYHDLRAVTGGALAGVACGALAYSLTTGFPLRYPVGFSYNAQAMMYAFGVFCALLVGAVRSTRTLPMVLAFLFLGLMIATTSIKMNLGLALGAAAVAVFHFRAFSGVLRRNLFKLLFVGVLVVSAVFSQPVLRQFVQVGFARASIGIEVLLAREDVSGYQGFNERRDWAEQGIEGWRRNPMFGNGVESLRDRLGATSHSTPIDLLHNSGLLGLFLFYGSFLLLLPRLALRAASPERASISALIFATLICYMFASLSAIVHYNPFLGAFLGLSVGLLSPAAGQNRHGPAQ